MPLEYFCRFAQVYVQLLPAFSVAVFFGSKDWPSASSSTVTLSGWMSACALGQVFLTVISTVSGVFVTVIVPSAPDTPVVGL